MSESPEAFKNHTRRTLCIFAAVLCGTFLMVGASFAPLPSHQTNLVLVLVAACFNAFIVAGFLMHLFSERKMIYTVLAFTAFFTIMLFILTIVAHNDVPRVAH
jgi:dihydroorotase